MQYFDKQIPEPGQVIRVRARQYLVENTESYGEDLLLRLACLDDDAQGEPLEILWNCEVDAELVSDTPWDRVAHSGFDAPPTFSAYLHTLRWHCVTSTDPDLFQAPHRAGIQVKDYQLEPLQKALKMPRVNLFIADDVGLGKTVEAGLILREMLLRQKIQRAVVACPPSVVRQWQEEMEQRFGLMFVVFDRAFVSAKRQERGYNVNPWKTHTRFIISHALLRDETYAAPLRDWLDDPTSGAAMFILDEAHNAAPASSSKYAIDSQLTREVRDISPRFAHRLFLSATPHNGHSNSFSALLEMLDPQRFCRGVPVNTKLLKSVMVRRLKSDLREVCDPKEFPKRHIVPIEITNLPKESPELRLAELLELYRQERLERLRLTPEGGRRDAMLVWISLQKRLLSSIDAFYRTLKVHAAALERATKNPPKLSPDTQHFQAELLLNDPSADDDRAELPEDEVQAEQHQMIERASRTTSKPTDKELALVREMETIAQSARHLNDSRLEQLRLWLQQHLCPNLGQPNASWNPKRVLIFTEYTDTKTYLERQLRSIIETSHLASQRIATFHGGMGDEAREDIKNAFNSDPQNHPLRILIATDAAREGVNLQNHCAHLFHFDIPWNPGRMEQRNGRIDRKLQRAPDVFCYYFVLKQRPEDRVLQTLVNKTKTILAELGSLPAVVERKIASTLAQGIERARAQQLSLTLEHIDQSSDAPSDEQTPLFSPSDRTAAAELESGRKRRDALARKLTELQLTLEKSRKHLDLNETYLCNALSVALNMLGAPKLTPQSIIPSTTPNENPLSAWLFPPLDQEASADPTWANTLDLLRYPPRKRSDKLDRWRREASLKPIVFSDTGTINDHIAHLHLEHRIVQRLLGRFLAQGFLHHELSRACVCYTPEAVGKVIVLARLSVFGPSATRLHEEILFVAADLPRDDTPARPANIPSDSLWQTLRSAFSVSQEISKPLQQRLSKRIPSDIQTLRSTLDTIAQSALSDAKNKLKERGEKEAKALSSVLNGQRTRLEEWQKKTTGGQLTLNFNTDERKQFEADQLHISSRLQKITEEIELLPRQANRRHYPEAVYWTSGARKKLIKRAVSR